MLFIYENFFEKTMKILQFMNILYYSKIVSVILT